MVFWIGFGAFLGLIAAAILSLIQLGELNWWSLLFGYSLGAFIPMLTATSEYLQSYSKV